MQNNKKKGLKSLVAKNFFVMIIEMEDCMLEIQQIVQIALVSVRK